MNMTKGTAFEVEIFKQMNLSQETIDAHIHDYSPIAQLIPLTTDEIREQGRDYNPREWDKRIDSLLTLTDGNVKWYKRDRNESPNGYDEYFSVFSNSTGIRVIHRVSYSASMTNTPWVEVAIDEDNILHYNRRSIRFKRNDTARDYLAEQSRTYGRIYTTIF
jgi:hypothetical protein